MPRTEAVRELPKATILTKVSPKETAYGVDPHAAIEKRFTITGARQRAPAAAAPEQPKIVSTKRGTKVERSSNPIIKEFMMNQELDKMLKQGAAETGPLHNAKKHPIPPPDENWHTDRPPQEKQKVVRGRLQVRRRMRLSILLRRHQKLLPRRDGTW